jgi:TRAP-type C4-dicarboxylate transport system permease large subunit
VSRPDVEGWLRVVHPVATVLILGLLLVALLIGIAPNLDTRVVELGERTWPGYAAELRSDPVPPTCEVDALEAKVAQCPPEGSGAAPQPAPAGDPFDEDPFAEDPFGDTPAPAPAPAPAADPFDGEDPFAEPAPAPEPAPADGSDPFGGDDPFAEEQPAEAQLNCPALRNLLAACKARHERYEEDSARITPALVRFRGFELAVADLAHFPYLKHLLALLVLLGAVTTTAARAHISLRNPTTRTEHRVRQVAELVAHLLWMASCVADRQVQANSAAESLNAMLPVIWAAGFAGLAAINLGHLVRPPRDLLPGRSTLPQKLMVVPLFAYMSMIAGVWFILFEQHWSGQAIYLHKFVQIPSIYTGVALYIWAGMLMSRTRVAQLGFDVLTPFELPPALLAWLVIVLAAYPVAYSGASGIFVIAVGAVIFERLRAMGASHRMAVATTAMSGSLGVVLRPCLVVVLIAVLNKQVTTDELFGWGQRVFLLTSAIALVAFLLWNKDPLRLPRMGVAVPSALRAMAPLVPYALVAAAVLVVYAVAFKTTVNEHTAALVLPVVLLAMVAWDRLGARRADLTADQRGLWPALTSATGESSHHVGALLLLMCGSVGLGGVVERAEVMSLVPASFGSIWLAMTVIVVVMVLVGMTMDPLGAVVLVSITIARVADDNGIAPVHFWMVVLVGFELGYLTPPVALNQLLARSVIGREAEVETVDPGATFFERYSHVIVPCAVMATALVIVAYVPLLFY